MRALRKRFWFVVSTALAVAILLINIVSQSHPTRTQSAASYVLSETTELGQYPAQTDTPNVNIISSLVNIERAGHGLKPLVKDSVLTIVAQQRASDMATRGYYAHRNPDGTYFYDQLDKQGYTYLFGCENLGLEFDMLPSTYINAWMNSVGGHKECLLNPGISRAGYAAIKLSSTASTTISVPAYIVVAVYANPG